MPWLKQRDVALLGNDGVNDVQPSGIEGSPRPIHQLAIVALGLPLVDVMDLEAAAETAARLKRWEFLVTARGRPGAGRHRLPAQSDRHVLDDSVNRMTADNAESQNRKAGHSARVRDASSG